MDLSNALIFLAGYLYIIVDVGGIVKALNTMGLAWTYFTIIMVICCIMYTSYTAKLSTMDLSIVVVISYVVSSFGLCFLAII